MKGAVFLDRDGTINIDPGYINDPNVMRLFPGAARALKALKNEGLKLFVVSNQSGYGRRLISEKQLNMVTERFENLLKEDGVTLDGIYYCPHLPEEKCLCRKPRTALIEKIIASHELNNKPMFFIGDKASDIEAGRKAGCRTVLVDSIDSLEKRLEKQERHDTLDPDYHAADLEEAARQIIIWMREFDGSFR